jgi:hypothetical protein
MKNMFVACTLAVLILCNSSLQAAEKVVVVPLGGTNVYIDPRNIVDAYGMVLASSFTTVTLLTVPVDKHFVLTDIVGEVSSPVTFYENKTRKLTLNSLGSEGNGYSVTLSSGIVFAPSSEVKIRGDDAVVTISGYYY